MHILASTKAGLDPRRPPVSLIAKGETTAFGELTENSAADWKPRLETAFHIGN